MSATRPALQAAVKSFSSIPGPLALPLVGSALQYRLGRRGKEHYHLALGDMYREYGPLVKEKIGAKEVVHVFDPEDIQRVYSVEGKWPVIPPLQETTAMYRAQKEMSLGLGNTNGEEWYRLRTNCQQRMLRPREVAHHLPGVQAIAQEMVHRIGGLRWTTCHPSMVTPIWDLLTSCHSATGDSPSQGRRGPGARPAEGGRPLVPGERGQPGL